MSLLDKYLPRYQFSERHTIDICASCLAVIDAARDYQPSSDPFFRSMITLREWPMRVRGWLRPRQESTMPPFGLHNFTLLEADEKHALVFGMAGRFWQLDYGQMPIADGTDFLAFSCPGTARLALGFVAERQNDGTTCLTTETRIFCQDPDALRRFTPYWYLIRPVSGLIRRRILSAIRREALRRLPGI